MGLESNLSCTSRVTLEELINFCSVFASSSM